MPVQSLVIAASEVNFTKLKEELGFTNTNKSIRHLTFTLTNEQKEKYNFVKANSDKIGEYELQIPPENLSDTDNYIICIGSFNKITKPTQYPVYLNGCLELTVPPNQKIREDLYWGLGSLSDEAI